ALDGRVRTGRRTEIDEALEEALDAEVRERAAEEDRRLLAGEEALALEARAGGVEQLEVVEQTLAGLTGERVADRGRVGGDDRRVDRALAARAPVEQQQLSRPAVVDAAEA